MSLTCVWQVDSLVFYKFFNIGLPPPEKQGHRGHADRDANQQKKFPKNEKNLQNSHSDCFKQVMIYNTLCFAPAKFVTTAARLPMRWTPSATGGAC